NVRMGRSRTSHLALLAATIATLAFMYLPLSLVIAYAFNKSGTQTWPPPGFTLDWVSEAIGNPGLRDAFLTSVGIALGATVIAMLLGSLRAFAVGRHHFFGRESVSFVLVLPIALPGVVTGMALSTTFATTGLPLGYL